LNRSLESNLYVKKLIFLNIGVFSPVPLSAQWEIKYSPRGKCGFPKLHHLCSGSVSLEMQLKIVSSDILAQERRCISYNGKQSIALAQSRTRTEQMRVFL